MMGIHAMYEAEEYSLRIALGDMFLFFPGRPSWLDTFWHRFLGYYRGKIFKNCLRGVIIYSFKQMLTVLLSLERSIVFHILKRSLERSLQEILSIS